VTFSSLICFILCGCPMSSDEVEFAMIFNEIYPALCRFLECMLGGSGHAQEIAQESFLRLYQNGLDNLPSHQVRFWLYRVARNLALNELNKRETRIKFFQSLVELFNTKVVNPERELEKTESNEIVLELLKTLPAEQRSILLLREQEEMSYSEIATILNI